MIGISKLYCGTVEPSDALRYGRHSSSLPSHLLQFSKDKRPVVVWNVTRKCNLKCVHCYAHATETSVANELSTQEGKALIDDLAAFGAPVMLFSGGEPLVRKDLPELAAYAVERGMRAVISTNGTLITAGLAKTLKYIGLSYVGISLDGMREINDRFRGVPGAYDKALDGIRNCQEAGIKVGLRFTINRFNVGDIPAIFDLLETMDIPRVCFYHLVYAGRGSKMVEEDLSLRGHPPGRGPDHRPHPGPSRQGPEQGGADRGQPRRRPLPLPAPAPGGPPARPGGPGTAADERGQQLGPRHRLRQLGRRGVCRPVLAPPQLRQCPAAPLFRDLDRPAGPLAVAAQREKKSRQGALRRLPWLDVCGGNFRVRAEAVTGDVWAPDPACYLSDEEIAQTI